MKRVFIIFIALAFFIIGACDKKGKSSKEASDDLVAQLLKENPLENTNTSTNILLEEEITEKYTNTNKQGVTEGGTSSSVSSNVEVVKDLIIKDEGIDVKPSKIELSRTSIKKGSHIIVGNDKSGQGVSPRKFLKITVAISTKLQNARYVDFYIYALPKGSDNLKAKYLIANVKNIEIINSQAQLTKYWNAKNIDGVFLDPGEYSIYVKFVVKEKSYSVIDKIERYWGNKDFYLKLY